MKKFICILTVLLILVSVTGCGCDAFIKLEVVKVTKEPVKTIEVSATAKASASPALDVSASPTETESQTKNPEMTSPASFTASPTETAKVTEAASETAKTSPTAQITGTPAITKAPVVTNTPAITKAPVVTDTPKITPAVTKTPVITATPKITQKITATPKITPSPTPSVTKAPGGVVSFDADVYMVPCVGQSLAVNTDAGPSTFSSTNSLSYNTSLQRTNLQDMNTGFCEGFQLMAKQSGVTIPSSFKIVTCVVGTGGTSINTFVKGTSHYSQIISNVRTAYNNCKNRGLTMIVPGFMWTQGEEDMRCGGSYQLYGTGDWNPFEYGMKLASIISNLNKDIKAITGQTNDIFCYSYQVACHNTYNRYPRIALEQAKLAETNDHMILAKTMYDVNYNVADYVHAPAATYRNMGNYYGMACFTTSVLHSEFKYTHVTNVENKGTEIILTYEVPVKPLKLDTSLVRQLDDGNYGFCIYNIPNETKYSRSTLGISKSATVIKKVEVVGDDKIKLTLNRAMTKDDTLTYGVNGIGWENITGYNITGTDQMSGHVNGARGCVRDSSPIKNNNSGAVLKNLYSWAPIFEYKI